jgi:hypothetical protein
MGMIAFAELRAAQTALYRSIGRRDRKFDANSRSRIFDIKPRSEPPNGKIIFQAMKALFQIEVQRNSASRRQGID